MNSGRQEVVKIVLTAAGLLGVLCGCRSDASRVNGEDFIPDGEMRTVARFAEVQSASAARTDATLYPYHFDCGELNSLGQAKLDLMLKDDDACKPLVVYLNLVEDLELRNHAQKSATRYLADAGLANSQYKFEMGPGIASSPASAGIEGLQRMREAQAAGGAAAGGTAMEATNP